MGGAESASRHGGAILRRAGWPICRIPVPLEVMPPEVRLRSNRKNESTPTYPKKLPSAAPPLVQRQYSTLVVTEKESARTLVPRSYITIASHRGTRFFDGDKLGPVMPASHVMDVKPLFLLLTTPRRRGKELDAKK